ncbi:metalloregulator ArsR/SmtB family transcription factor [Myxococcus sp. SDU36]|uniref:ArsR/SmtB family transcription factor n=1 Tax=Myxococcus sp. SDU36 TaxID=2831967 RepID=UPI002542DF78|nr:metalloregulator ArsR/SmtB family transcription factor [Myxococcus sp. SDU36]WIG92974.1 metalloregulator ArsR/SmtB family transcription factor [Myxococcus sp. SDU36]
MIETFTALADPNRFRIVEYLLGGARSVGAIGEALHLNQPQVSKHLRVLKEARLVDVEARAQQRLYGLRPEPLRELNAWLERYRDIWDERLGQLDSLLEELKTQDLETAQRHPRKKKG